MKWAGPLFYDETVATETMRGHLFYSVLVSFLSMSLHYVFITYATRRKLFGDAPIPGGFKFPQFEIKVAMGLAIGTLDAGLSVLATPAAAPGWKFFACLEVLAAGTFVYWFIGKGREFRRTTRWVPISNTKFLRSKSSMKKVLSYLPAPNDDSGLLVLTHAGVPARCTS